jgi:hypothetical protein
MNYDDSCLHCLLILLLNAKYESGVGRVLVRCHELWCAGDKRGAECRATRRQSVGSE